MTFASEAAALIAEYDRAAADRYAANPFHRRALAEAFTAGFRTHSPLSRKICEMVATLTRLDAMDRAEGAA